MGDVGWEKGDGDEQDLDATLPSPISRLPFVGFTIAALLAAATSQLSSVSDTPRLDAEVLLAHVLGRDRTYLFTWPDRQPDEKEVQAFHGLVERRAAGEPVAYLTGQQAFWSFSLKVSGATLIPRADTELLVETALERVGLNDARVLDLGTGTGAIALALASERPAWSLMAVDRELAAVELARDNAQALGLTNVEIMASDWFVQVPSGQEQGKFHLIVSNPPYIDPDDPHLQQGAVRFEPHSALVAANRGLADLERIIADAPAFLHDGGWLMVEHGADQGAAVRNLFASMGYGGVETLRDIAGLERVTLGVWGSSLTSDL